MFETHCDGKIASNIRQLIHHSLWGPVIRSIDGIHSIGNENPLVAEWKHAQRTQIVAIERKKKDHIWNSSVCSVTRRSRHLQAATTNCKSSEPSGGILVITCSNIRYLTPISQWTLSNANDLRVQSIAQARNSSGCASIIDIAKPGHIKRLRSE